MKAIVQEQFKAELSKKSAIAEQEFETMDSSATRSYFGQRDAVAHTIAH